MQQSKKLIAEESENKKESYLVGVSTAKVDSPPTKAQTGAIKIRPITMYNDWVAILQEHDKVEGGIELSNKEALARPEGVVVGVNSKGMPDGAGGYIPAQVELGDRVAFQQRSVLQGFTPANDSDSPYRGNTIVIVSERNIIYKMTGKVDFQIID